MQRYLEDSVALAVPLALLEEQYIRYCHW